jgi:hypothetical protein
MESRFACWFGVWVPPFEHAGPLGKDLWARKCSVARALLQHFRWDLTVANRQGWATTRELSRTLSSQPTLSLPRMIRFVRMIDLHPLHLHSSPVTFMLR